MDDLLNIKGLSEKKLARIKGSVEVGGDNDKDMASH
ncbi:hypothetical protein F3F96_02200 [Mariprofundus sp. NF]|nr:hypothetical protein [Mariprofundus sp. NF]